MRMKIAGHRVEGLRTTFAVLILLVLTSLGSPAMARAQAPEDVKDSSASGALLEILVSACRANEIQFANSLAGENPAAFRALSLDQRTKVIKRISLSDTAGKPLRSTGKDGLPVFRCQSETGTVEYRLGIPRTHENLAFIPVTVMDDTSADFGLIRETSGWHLLSIGLVMLDIPQLAKQWADQDLAAQEDNAVANLNSLANAIQTYNRAFGKLPESLDQLGPAPKNEISPELASLVDANMAAGKKDGYNFRYRIVPDSAGNDTSFELAATPASYPKTGRRSFFLDGTGKIHGADNEGAVATFEDPLIEGEKSE
jgi:type II secretory pathway pseudopilin PulG